MTKRSVCAFAFTILAATPAVCQTPDPSFEVASIRPGAGGRDFIEIAQASLTMRNTSLSRCVAWAFNVQDFQVSAPTWMNEARFDIVAKAAAAAPEPEMRIMLQRLLAERFKLEFHRDQKDMPALILTVGKNGHKLKPVETEGSPSFTTGKLNLTGKGARISQLTNFLSRQLRAPVIDQTGLTGRYDFFMDINAFVTEDIRKNMPSDGPPLEAGGIIARAVQEQLGLKVESHKASVEMIVVDRMEKDPTEN